MFYRSLFTLLCLSTTAIFSDFYTVYAHGIIDGPQQMNRFIEAIATDAAHNTALTFPDTIKETKYDINRLASEVSTSLGKPFNRSNMYMGQNQDIQTVHQTVQSHSHDQLILYGCSRGAAAIIGEVSTHNPTNVAAIVLDAAPANMPATLHGKLALLGIHLSYDTTVFSTIFPAYPYNSITPFDAIKNIKNKNLPILLLHSENDLLVSFDHALKLYKELKKEGFTNVYFARIKDGRHSFMLKDKYGNNAPDTCRKPYLQAVHSFYKKYKLPYNPEYATDDMTPYEHNLDQINYEIQKSIHRLQQQYRYSVKRNTVAVILTTAAILLYAYRKASS